DRRRAHHLASAMLLPELARRLRHRDPAIRRRSAVCLAQMGPAAGHFAQSLLAALHDDDSLVRTHAAVALGNGRPTSPKAELEKLVFDGERRVAQVASAGLDRIVAANTAGGQG